MLSPRHTAAEPARGLSRAKGSATAPPAPAATPREETALPREGTARPAAPAGAVRCASPPPREPQGRSLPWEKAPGNYQPRGCFRTCVAEQLILQFTRQKAASEATRRLQSPVRQAAGSGDPAVFGCGSWSPAARRAARVGHPRSAAQRQDKPDRAQPHGCSRGPAARARPAGDREPPAPGTSAASSACHRGPRLPCCTQRHQNSSKIKPASNLLHAASLCSPKTQLPAISTENLNF